MLGRGLVGDMVAGAVTGGIVAVASPTINQYVPRVAMFAPTTIALTGVGVAGKMMHKGGNFTTAALILGSAMAAHDLMSSTGLAGAAGATSSQAY
jgi:phage baseplate assembly protein gpV